MSKIGRNDPCPCGSGKKYKKCFMDKPTFIPNLKRSRIRRLWTYEEVNEMTTEEIIQLLLNMGIPFDKDEFLRDTEECYSAEQISEGWFRFFEVTAEGRDEDFPWLAAWVLWERLAPANNLSLEKMSDLIDEGADYSFADDPATASDIWLRVWEALKYKCKFEPSTLAFLDGHYRGSFFVSNFVQDLEIELHNAGVRDKTYFQKRIDYCREFLNFFPDEDELITHNTRRAIAKSYASLGDYERAELEFEKLVQDFPNNPWGYIGWGDMHFRRDDYGKAKELYTRALTVTTDKGDIAAVQERLEDLEEAIKTQEQV